MEKIIINDYIQGDPLSEENLDKTLEYVYKIRLLMPKKLFGFIQDLSLVKYSEVRQVTCQLKDTIMLNADELLSSAM